MQHTQCRYHLHADGTVGAPFEWFGSVRGQTVYVPQGHPSGMGGMSIYINAQGRFALPRSGRVLAEACRKSTESSRLNPFEFRAGLKLAKLREEFPHVS